MKTPSHTLASFFAAGLLAAAAHAAPPNIVFVLVDDMGWTDLGCFGSPYYETPNVDRLAAQGMRFTDAYAACTVCSPSRASILTGQYPARLHITDWIEGHKRPFAKLKVPDWTMRLSPEIPNLARTLKAAGYATASIGKWHLGDASCYPDKQGFDVNVGGDSRGHSQKYFAPYAISTLPEGPDGEFLTDREAAEAEKFIRANRDRPFFVYLAHYAVHMPIAAKPAVIEKYKAKRDKDAPHRNAVYAGLVESVDDALGRVLRTLDELALTERTVIVFTSDNGGLLGCTSNTPLRAGKGSPYEGGVRVPLIVKWPGVTKPGSVCAAPVIGADYFPTLLAMAGVPVPAGHTVDGESLVPLLKQSGALARDAIYWHYPHYHPGAATPYSAVRSGDFRLVEFYEDNRVELYNLKDDIGEAHDLAAALPEKAAALRQQLHDWRARVGAQAPTPNPAYDPERDGKKK
ncbi:MAG: sulfatase [Verrucomicrobiota bacterium]|jgi:arylsulfatase A-like enzyme|nr:sulfatase [Verrucomicrobiota bacterium]